MLVAPGGYAAPVVFAVGLLVMVAWTYAREVRGLEGDPDEGLAPGHQPPPGERQRAQNLAQELGCPFVDLDRVRPDRDALAALPVQVIRDLQVLPIKRDGQNLWVAVSERDPDAENEAATVSGLRLHPVIAPRSALVAAIEALPDRTSGN